MILIDFIPVNSYNLLRSKVVLQLEQGGVAHGK